MLRDPVAENKTNDKNVERTNLPGPTFKDLGDPAREIISEEGIGVNTVGNQQVSGMFDCDECNAVFKSRSALRLHIQSKHEGVIYRCDKCDFKTTLQGNLARHKKGRHEGIMYNCTQCDYKADRQEKLTQT